jgi:hypothetical protein
MAEAQAERGRGPRGGVALGFAIAALAASWNPIAAPFGLLVGVAAMVLGARALRTAGDRRLPAAALAIGVVAALASIVILLLTAGAVGVELPGEPVVKGRTQAELDQALDEARERTRAERERASKELDRLPGPGPSRVQRTPARDGGRDRSPPEADPR